MIVDTEVGQSSMVQRIGLLAKKWCNQSLPLQVLRSNAGYYIGTATEEGPCSRESEEYYPDAETARLALKDSTFTQRDRP